MRHLQSSPSLRLVLAAAALLIATSSALKAQVIVYRLDFEELPGSVNFDFYEDGFLIVPALGGEASLVLATEEKGLHLFARADNAGRHFVTLGEGGRQARAVFSAYAEGDSAQAYYLLTGDLNHTISGRSAVFEFTSRASNHLKGYALASDDESSAAQPAEDGSIGYAGLANVEASLLNNRTFNANARGLSVEQAANELVALLQANGYIDEATAGDATQSLDEAAFFLETGESGAASFDSVVEQAESNTTPGADGGGTAEATTAPPVSGFASPGVTEFPR